MINEWQKSLNSNGIVGAILMDLSKAFDVLPHDLLIAKLAAYRFGTKTLHLIYNYLKGRKQRVCIGSHFSDFLEVLLGVPQGSVLGPLFFNIFINDLLFLVRENICNFADDNTLYVCGSNLESVLFRLQAEMEIVLDWFSNNGMVANPDKFQAMFLGTKNNSIGVSLRSTSICSSKSVELLGVTIDDQLSFYPHIAKVCQKASAKIKALMRIRNYLTQKQADVIYNSYIMSPFNYCPLVWMFCCKKAHNLINITHHKALCARLNTFTYNMDELIQLSKSNYIHTKNLRLMLIEVFKSWNHLNPPIMWEFFTPRENTYNLRQGISVFIPRANNSKTLNSFTFRAAMAWNNLPANLKLSDSLNGFRFSLNKIAIHCKCKNCKF